MAWSCAQPRQRSWVSFQEATRRCHRGLLLDVLERNEWNVAESPRWHARPACRSVSPMCRPARCAECGKATYAGCGMHIDQVLAGVPAGDRCRCGEGGRPKPRPWWRLW